VFILSNFLSLLLQTGGGAIAVIADNFSFEDIGIHLMLAGLALQVASLVVILILAGDFALRCWRRRWDWDEKFEIVRDRRYFNGFLFGETNLSCQEEFPRVNKMVQDFSSQLSLFS